MRLDLAQIVKETGLWWQKTIHDSDHYYVLLKRYHYKSHDNLVKYRLDIDHGQLTNVCQSRKNGLYRLAYVIGAPITEDILIVETFNIQDKEVFITWKFKPDGTYKKTAVVN